MSWIREQETYRVCMGYTVFCKWMDDKRGEG